MFHKLIRIIDFFLPSSEQLSTGRRLRARTAIFTFILVLAYESIFLVFGILADTLPGIALSLTVMVLNFICLFLARKSYSVNNIVVMNLCVFPLIGMADAFLVSKSILCPSIFYYSMNLFFACIMLENARTRFLILALYLTVTAFFFTWAGKLGLAYPDGLPGSLFVGLFTTILLLLFLLFWIKICLRILDFAEIDLEREIDWQIRSNRLTEIASITSIFSSLMRQPVIDLRRDWQVLDLETYRAEDVAAVGRMNRELDQLLQISGSLTWIYRIFQQEGAEISSSNTLIHQLQAILATKAAGSGWTIKAKSPAKNLEMHGHVPSVLLLIFMIGSQILESASSGRKKNLEIEMNQDEESIVWKLSWPLEAMDFAFPWDHHPYDQGKIAADTLRAKLIRELKRISKVSITNYEDADRRHVLITRTWRRFGPSMPLPSADVPSKGSLF